LKEEIENKIGKKDSIERKKDWKMKSKRKKKRRSPSLCHGLY
jgi:hypothetical protein